MKSEFILLFIQIAILIWKSFTNHHFQERPDILKKRKLNDLSWECLGATETILFKDKDPHTKKLRKHFSIISLTYIKMPTEHYPKINLTTPGQLKKIHWIFLFGIAKVIYVFLQWIIKKSLYFIIFIFAGWIYYPLLRLPMFSLKAIIIFPPFKFISSYQTHSIEKQIQSFLYFC